MDSARAITLTDTTGASPRQLGSREVTSTWPHSPCGRYSRRTLRPARCPGSRASPCSAPASPHGPHNVALVGGGLFPANSAAWQAGVIRRQTRGVFRAHPPHRLVLGRVAIGIFDRQLRLADAASPAIACVKRGALPRGELLFNRLKQIGASRKVGIAAVRHVPDGWQRAGKRGCFVTARGGAPGKVGEAGGLARPRLIPSRSASRATDSFNPTRST